MTEPQNTEPAADDTEQTFRDAFTPPWADEDAPDAEAYESAIRAFNGELRASGRHAPAGVADVGHCCAVATPSPRVSPPSPRCARPHRQGRSAGPTVQ